MNNEKTLSQTLVKGIDFYTEEYIKQLLQETYPGKRFQTMNAVNFNKSFEVLPYTLGKANGLDSASSRLLNAQQGTVFIGKVSIAIDLKAIGAHDTASAYFSLPYIDLNFLEPFGAGKFTVNKFGNASSLSSAAATGDDYVARWKEMFKDPASLETMSFDLIFSDVEHVMGTMYTQYNVSGSGWTKSIDTPSHYYLKYNLQFTGFRAVMQ